MKKAYCRYTVVDFDRDATFFCHAFIPDDDGHWFFKIFTDKTILISIFKSAYIGFDRVNPEGIPMGQDRQDFTLSS